MSHKVGDGRIKRQEKRHRAPSPLTEAAVIAIELEHFKKIFEPKNSDLLNAGNWHKPVLRKIGLYEL